MNPDIGGLLCCFVFMWDWFKQSLNAGYEEARAKRLKMQREGGEEQNSQEYEAMGSRAQAKDYL